MEQDKQDKVLYNTIYKRKQLLTHREVWPVKWFKITKEGGLRNKYMYKNDVGKGGVLGYKFHEVK